MSPKLLLMLPTTSHAQHRQKVCSEKRCSSSEQQLHAAGQGSNLTHQKPREKTQPVITGRIPQALFTSQSFGTTPIAGSHPHKGSDWEKEGRFGCSAAWVRKCWQSLWRSSGVQGKEAAKVSLLPELKLLAKLPLAAGALLKRIAENKLGEI